MQLANARLDPPEHHRDDCGEHVVLPAERFYWAVVETRALPGRCRLDSPRYRAQCRHLAEPSLPCELERLQVALAPLGDSAVLACALEQSVVSTEAHSGVISLTPDRIPGEIWGGVERGDAEAQNAPPESWCLNLLHGPFEPPLVRRERRRVWLAAITAAAVVLTMLAFGFERRVAALTSSTQSLQTAEDELIRRVLPAPSEDSVGLGQSPRVRLLAEWRRLEQTRGAEQSDVVIDLDASAPLAALLARWPSGAHATVQSLSATAASLVVRCEAPSDEAETIIGALLPWDDWRRLQPELTTRQGVATVTCRFTRGASGSVTGVPQP